MTPLSDLPSAHQLRPPRRGETPTISVVVASRGDRSVLEGCLQSLVPQCHRASAQLIVARAGSEADVLALRKSIPDVSVVAAPASASMAELRALGMAESTGDIVALTEDDCVIDDAWVQTLMPALGSAKAGGDMTSGPNSATGWAEYFSERGSS